MFWLTNKNYLLPMSGGSHPDAPLPRDILIGIFSQEKVRDISNITTACKFANTNKIYLLLRQY
jgi:hypothetical protein